MSSWMDILLHVEDLVRDYVSHSPYNGHEDNTGAACRYSPTDHDCCYHCNLMQDIIEAHNKYYGDINNVGQS